MTSKRNYSRYFIILQEDEKGYSIDQNKFPTGYAKVERKNNKCKVSYYVQNLKSNKEPYYMFLICDRKKDKRLIKVGKINIDNYGRAEVSYEYDIDNIANCNIPMDNIKGASIVRINENNVHGILTGFVSGANLDDWKSYAVIENEKRENKEEVKEESKGEVKKDVVKEKETIKEENIFDKYEREVENHTNIVADENKTGKNQFCQQQELKEDNIEKEYELRESIDNADIEVDTNEKIEYENEEKIITDEKDMRLELQNEKNLNNDNLKEDVDKKDESIELNDSTRKSKENKKDKKSKKSKEKLKEESKHSDKIKYKEKSQEKCKDQWNDKEECPYKGSCHMNWEKEFYKHIVEGLEEEKDICQEVGKCKWYKISYTNLMNMRPGIDFSKYSILYYPMMNYYSYIMKNGHYLVGFKYDKNGKMKHLVYAIPGTKSMLDQPFNGATGFVTWVYRDIKNINHMSMGYWIMFYDFKNSTVVIPVKK